MKPYRDMPLRRAQLLDFLHQRFLDRRRLWIRDPFASLGASLAIAGAAALSRTTLCSLDAAMALLAAGNEEIDTARMSFVAYGVWMRQ